MLSNQTLLPKPICANLPNKAFPTKPTILANLNYISQSKFLSNLLNTCLIGLFLYIFPYSICIFLFEVNILHSYTRHISFYSLHCAPFIKFLTFYFSFQFFFVFLLWIVSCKAAPKQFSAKNIPLVFVFQMK